MSEQVELVTNIATGQVEAEFLDGVAAIPTFVIEALGGPSEIERLLPSLKSVSFGDFMNGYRSIQADRYARSLLNGFVEKHFRPF